MESGQREQVWEQDRSLGEWLAGVGHAIRVRAYGLLDDGTLVRRARARDHAAFDALTARYRDRLYTMALDSLGDERAASEALCEMLVMAHRDLDSWSPDCAPRTWLYLHGIHAVLRRSGVPMGRFRIASRSDSGAASQAAD